MNLNTTFVVRAVQAVARACCAAGAETIRCCGCSHHRGPWKFSSALTSRSAASRACHSRMARPSSCTGPQFCRQAAVERHRREGGWVERPGRRPGHPSAVRPVGQLHCLGYRRIGSAEASRPRAVSSTPSRRRCSPGGAEPLTRETSSSTALALPNRSTSRATRLEYFCALPGGFITYAALNKCSSSVSPSIFDAALIIRIGGFALVRHGAIDAPASTTHFNSPSIIRR